MAITNAIPAAMANNVSVTTPLVGNSLSLKHSVFVAKVVNRNAYRCNTWVLDIGAIDHIIYFVILLTTITSLTQCIVELPNGESDQVTHIGSVQLFGTLVLDNVLCVPSFSFNLFFVHKQTHLENAELPCLPFWISLYPGPFLLEDDWNRWCA